MSDPLAGFRVAITGASSGIGAALAAELAGRGAQVALIARRAEVLATVAAGLPGGPHPVIAADIADPLAAEASIRQAHAALGRLDAVVLNAGYGLAAPAAATSDAEWRAILATNLLVTAAGLRAAVPLLRTQEPQAGWRGRIVIVSSALARRAMPDTAAYSATKAAQLSLAEAARVELAPDRIAVSSVHPVRTRTAFFATAEQVGGRRMDVGDRAPTQDAATVAQAICRGLIRPRPEIWPHRSSRWLLLLATAWPSLADRLLAGHRRG
jgi:short-subunit dehydrogenase